MKTFLLQRPFVVLGFEEPAVRTHFIELLTYYGIYDKTVVCAGRYNGKNEYSLIIYFDWWQDATKLDVVKRLAKQCKQQSLLLVNCYRDALLMYTDHRPSEDLGKWRLVNHIQAVNSKAYTAIPMPSKDRTYQREQYFICD